MGPAHNKIYATASDGARDERLDLKSAAAAISTLRRSAMPLVPPPKSALDWLRRPRKTLWRRVVRPLQRRYRQLPWASRETVSVAVTLYAIFYVVVSVPLRVGFFYDPIHPATRREWSYALSVFTVLDVVSDTIGVYEFVDFYHTYQDAFSQLSQSVSFELGKKLAKKTHNHAAKPKVSTRNRQTASLRSSQAQWTLATIVPAAVASAQSAAAMRQRKRVALLLELVALVPIEIAALATRRYNLLHVLRATKLCRAHRLGECLDKISRIYGQQRWIQTVSLTGISNLVRNVALGVLLCHWVACGYMWIAHRTCGLHQELCDARVLSSWVIKDRLMGASIARKYSRALYWASRTMVVLGYDDVTPISNGETLYGLFVQLCGALLSTSLLATFLFIFRHRVSKQAAFNAHVDNAREYMKSQNMPQEVRRQVMAYFSYAWATHHSLDGEEALHLLPKHLESKVVYTLKASRIKQVCFLMRESVEFINLLALALVHRVYIPSDSIIEPKINAKMFFVIRGTVLLSAFDGSHPKECQKGDFFADCCLLCPEKYEEKAVAKTFCELYVLEKAAFDDAVSHFYRGKEQETLTRMAATLERYATQLRKTKKLLGLRGAEDSTVATSPDRRQAAKRGAIGWRLPGSLFRIRWDILRLLTTIYVAFEVPYYIIFISNHDAQKNFLVFQDRSGRYIITLLIEIFFMCDFVLRCRFFAYMDPVVMINVVDPAMILSAYKTNGFYFDLIAVVPIALIMESLEGVAEDYSWIFRLLRMLRLRYAGELLQDITDFYSVSSKIQLILALLLGVTLTLHLVACLWFEMAWIPRRVGPPEPTHGALTDMTRLQCLDMATHFQNCSWVRYDCYGNLGIGFPFEDKMSRYQTTFAYVRSIYWAVVALTGVGYGDIVAFSTAESYFAAVWIFVSGILNFGIVGAMSSTISNLLAAQHHHVDKLNTLNSLMEHLGISESLRGEIRRFYHHQFKTRKNAYESQLLMHLPDQLCYQISSLLHSEATKRVPLFDSASREFLEEVTGKFRHRTYQNGETLCIEGDVCKEFLVLSHGKVNMFLQAISKCPVGALVGGDCYGVNEFLLRRPHTVTLVAASAIHASVMAREHFDVILRKFEDEMADITDEAHDAWLEDMARQKKITKNLLSIFKLKTHVLSTPSLFYQKEHQAMDDSSSPTSGRAWLSLPKSRDADAVRSSVMGVWNLILTFWNIYSAFKIIFRIAFHAHIEMTGADFHTFVIVDLICDAYYAADIYLKLYYFDCEEVGLDNLLTRAEMNSSYRKSRHFKRDLLASLPLYYMKESAPLASSLCRIPRLLRCFDLWAYIDDTIILIQQTFASKNISAYLGPLKLLFFLMLGVHYAACVFFMISEHECVSDPTHCWMSHDHILQEYEYSLMALYVRCFYWALTSLTLVGSREIVSRDISGTLWATTTCLGTTFIMGFILGELSELILDMDKEAKEYKERIDIFERFAKEHELSETLQSRVSFFFKTQFDHAEGKELSEAVNDMSANLKLKLMHEIYGSSIAKLPISRFLTNAQVNNLSLRLKTELFIPGDDIVVEDTFGTRLCIMRTGLAAVLWSESSTSVALLMEGCLFGEIAFFLPTQRRLATVKATTSCEVLYIAKHAWNELWSGSSDENNVQQYAMHAILDWVKDRLLSYQESALNVAKRTSRHLMQRKIVENLQGMMAPVKNRVLKHVRGSHVRSFLTPERLILEKKAKYLLSRANKHAAQLEDLLASHNDAGRSATSTNFDYRRSHRERPQIGVSASVHQQQKHRKALKTVDLNFGQFYVDVNPVNKHVAPHLDNHHLHLLESESWRRFRYMATLQHTVTDLMDELIQLARARAQQQQACEQQSRRVSSAHRHSHRSSVQAPRGRQPLHVPEKTELAVKRIHTFHTDDRLGRRPSTFQASAPKPDDQRLFIATNHTVTLTDVPVKRMESQQSGRLLLTRAVSVNAAPEATTEETLQRAAMLRRMKRCLSLPHFDRKYFATVKRQEEHKSHTRRGAAMGMESMLLANVGITFDILQRSRRPKFSSLYHLYRRFRRWTGDAESTDSSHDAGESDAQHTMAPQAPVRPQRASMLVSTLQLLRPSSVSAKRHSSIRWQRAQQQKQRGTTAKMDAAAESFRLLVRRCSKSWDLLMLLVALYHALVTPLKVCFRHDLQLLPGLKVWSGIEYCMDFLCTVDVAVRMRRARAQLEHARASHRKHHHHHHHHSHVRSRLAAAFASMSLTVPRYDGLALDVVAVLPLELFAFAIGGVSAWSKLAYHDKWLHLSFLRLNKVLLARHIPDLSESVAQYALYDLKVPIAEAQLNFLRSLASYVLMGHWMACMWFAVSEQATHEFAASWMAYPGMLAFAIDNSGAGAASSHRRLSGATSHSFDLASISLTRKFLRSMHFALNSITTLWYGDIASLNLLELLVEMAFITWSIYIYGVLVGAHGELLEAHSRREALFEQNLSELQHYLLQNNVPKLLKKQIKQYYASIWRRRNGEDEFEAVAGISRALHEDVVYATLHRFAWKVSIFHALDVHFLRALLVKLQYVVCSENEEVVIRGDVDRSMYFISDGRVLVKRDKSEATKEKGDFFGELALLYGIPRGETCIALTVSELYRLDEQPYEELLLEFPEYRAKNRAEWTTTEPPPSVLTSLLHSLSLGAAVQSLTSGDATTAVSVSAVLDEEVARSFVYKATMELLAQLDPVDSLQAKFIIHRARAGARKRLKQLTGLETARAGDALDAEDGGGDASDDGARPLTPALSKRRQRRSLTTTQVHDFSDHDAS